MMCTTMLSLLCARDSACNISSVFTLCGALPEYFPQTVKQMKPTRHGVLDPLSSGHAENAARHVIKYDCKLGVGPDYAAKLPFLQRMLSFSLSRLCIALTASIPPSLPPTRFQIRLLLRRDATGFCRAIGLTATLSNCLRHHRLRGARRRPSGLGRAR